MSNLVDTIITQLLLGLQAGCEDGSVRLFDVTNDGLCYSKSLDQQQGTEINYSLVFRISFTNLLR